VSRPVPHFSWQQSGFTLGGWRVEPGRNTIMRGQIERHLENRLMQTLVFLAENSGRVVRREEFFETVWQGRVVNEEALSRAISLLRTALDDQARAPEFIQTIPGVGYRLIAAVGGVDEQEAKAVPTPVVELHSIAVLPFVNLSDEASNEYFSDGISEEILNVLAQIERFKVVGRTSSFKFKDRNEDLREVGRILNVAHVLEGSVRKSGARVRITAQLIDTDNGFHLWSETFDRELGDIFDIQDDIASAVVKALKVKLLGRMGEPQVIGGTHDPQAFQAYLLGMHYRNRGALRQTVEQAARALERAIELDPDYARAHAALACTWIDRLWNGYVTHELAVRRINALASRAIELAPELADSYLALGLLLQVDYADKRSALDAISTAVRLNPGSARMQMEYARLNSHYGNRKTCVAAARKAVELDPVSVFARHILGHVLYFSRQFEEAIDAFRQALELDPHYPKPHYFIAMSLHWLGDSESALEEIRLETLQWMKLTAATVILHRLGRSEEAEVHFGKLIELGIEENNFVQQAGIHAQLGQVGRALDCLELAFGQGDPGLTQLYVDPFLDPLRAEPRFEELLVKVGLGPDEIPRID